MLNADQIENIYPLSPMQRGLLFHNLYAPESGVYLQQSEFTLQGDLDTAAFIRAWEEVVARHAVLRTAMIWENLDQPMQVVLRQARLPLEQHDWRALTADEQQAQLKAFIEADRVHSFNVAAAPLMRLALLRLADDTYQFIWSCHHLILDGWSIPLVLGEVFAFYGAAHQGRALNLELPRPYADYIAWLQRQDPARAETFWRERLRGFTAPTPLGIDRPFGTAPGQQATFDERQVQLAETVAALQAFVRQHRLTVSTLLQGAWALLLSRYSGETDVVFGATVSGRPPDLAGVETMVGLFINTLPVRVELPPDTILLPWLKQLHTQQAEAQEYEYSPLVDVQGWSEVHRRTPLFDSILVFENYPLGSFDQQGSSLQVGNPRSLERTHYPLTLLASQDTALSLRIMFDCHRFDSAAISRMLGHLQMALEGMAAHPDQRLADVPWLTAAERQQIVVEWNDTQADYRRDVCLHELFEEQVARTPNAPAVVFGGQGSGVRGQGDKETRRQGLPRVGTRGDKETRRQETGVRSQESEFLAPNPSPPPALRLSPIPNPQSAALSPQSSVLSPQSLTYVELNRRANQLAHLLQSVGVGRGAMVAVFMERAPEMIPALLGILKAGGAYVPMEVTFPQARVQWILTALNVRCVITQTAQLPTVFAIAPSLPLLEHVICLDAAPVADLPAEQPRVWTHEQLAQQPQNNLPARASPIDLAYVIFTSGSTGTPKGVMVQHQPVVNLIEWVNRRFSIGADDRVLLVASLCFDLSVYDIFGLLAAGGSIHVADEQDMRDPERLLRLLCTEPITFWDSAPAALQQIAALFLSAAALGDERHLRLVFLSGDWIPVTLPDAVRQTFPSAQVIGLGGATEATVWSNFYPIGVVEPHWVSIPYGKPIQNAAYYVLDGQLNPCPVGVRGDLYIGGECLVLGYANDPVLTAGKFVPNPFAQGMGDGGWGMEDSPPIPHPSPPPALRLSPITRLYRTGDQARFWPDGNIEFLGRVDHQVKIRGFRIELGEIETVLSGHPAVRDAAVLARADVAGDRRLVAYVVPSDGLQVTSSEDASLVARHSSLVDELRGFLRQQLPEYMVPSAFVLLEALPVTANGKLDRRALPAVDRTHLSQETEFVAPRTPLEAKLAEKWAEVLGVERIGIHDNFFDLGGHSLMATQLISRLREAFQVDLPLQSLFEMPTVAGLAERIEVLRWLAQDLEVPSDDIAEDEAEEVI